MIAPTEAPLVGAALLRERVAALMPLLGEAGVGGLAPQIQTGEEIIFGKKKSGALPARVSALEMMMGL